MRFSIYNSHAKGIHLIMYRLLLSMSLVSIITATYNRDHVIGRAIESVLSQSYQNFEYIIVDDASTDNTKSVVNSYQDDRIQYICLDQNSGANAARNVGISESNGKYITILDSDDEYLEDRIKKMVDELEELSDVFAGVCHPYYTCRDGEIVGIRNIPDNEITMEQLKDGNAIGSFLSVMFRADLFESIGLLDEEMVAAQDYEYYLRVAKDLKFKKVDHCLAKYHSSSDSISTNTRKKIKAQNQLVERHGMYLTNRQYSKHNYLLFFRYYSDGELKNAQKSLIKSLKHDPKRIQSYYYLIFTIFGLRGIRTADFFKTKISRLLI